MTEDTRQATQLAELLREAVQRELPNTWEKDRVAHDMAEWLIARGVRVLSEGGPEPPPEPCEHDWFDTTPMLSHAEKVWECRKCGARPE